MRSSRALEANVGQTLISIVQYREGRGMTWSISTPDDETPLTVTRQYDTKSKSLVAAITEIETLLGPPGLPRGPWGVTDLKKSMWDHLEEEDE